jgi:hypothetical protein
MLLSANTTLTLGLSAQGKNERFRPGVMQHMRFFQSIAVSMQTFHDFLLLNGLEDTE